MENKELEYCEKCGYIMEQCTCQGDARGIINKIQPKRTPYNRTKYLISRYRDLKSREEISGEISDIRLMIDQAVEKISDDRYINVLKDMMAGVPAEETAERNKIDISNVYRQKKRLVKRLSVIIYGDEAL